MTFLKEYSSAYSANPKREKDNFCRKANYDRELEVQPVSDSPSHRTVVLKILVADAFDGATRLLNDLQRFGLCIRRFHLDAEVKQASIDMTLTAPVGADPTQITARLARHGTVVFIEAIEPSEDNARLQNNVRHPAHSVASQC